MLAVLAALSLVAGCSGQAQVDEGKGDGMHAGKGPWKEGRVGGASLCYVGLSDEELGWVAKHHGAVWIRATVACERFSVDALRPLAERNWDLAIRGGGELDAAAIAAGLNALDGRAERGWVWDDSQVVGDQEAGLYHVVAKDGVVAGPGPDLAKPLPSRALPTDLAAAKRAIDEVVMAGEWAIWRVDSGTLAKLTPAEHERLLKWLGDHHMRIWCAPVRDIGTWAPPGGDE